MRIRMNESVYISKESSTRKFLLIFVYLLQEMNRSKILLKNFRQQGKSLQND